jgi:hypothetical protein
MLQSLSILVIVSVFSSCELLNDRPIPLDSKLWAEWDAGMYADERYNMTLWLFQENWFEEKTKQDIIRDLPERYLQEIKGNDVSYSVKFTNGFMERWNIDYKQQDLGILTIYFENDVVIKAEYKERKNVNAEYNIKRNWNK